MSARVISEPEDTTRLRHVFYLPGFDPREPEAYWGLMRRESRLTAVRRRMTIEVAEPVRSAEGHSLDWAIESVERGVRTRTRYGLLRWDDIVRTRFPRSNLTRLIAIPVLWLRLWRSGYLRAFRQEAWQFWSVIVFVHLCYALLAVASVTLAAGAVTATPIGDAPLPVQIVAIAATAYGLLGLLTRATKARPFYVTHLVDDTAFTHEHAAGRAPDMEARLDAWAERIQAAEADASEVVVVGHSSSSFLAIETIDRVLARDPHFGRRGTPVTLLTFGSVIPWIALDPLAVRFRRALRRVAEAHAIGWCELRAPWDWLSIHRRSPLEASNLEVLDPDRPTMRNVAIADLIEPDSVAMRRWNFFRMHFQLLMSSRDRHAFDYIALVAGAEPVHRAIAATEPMPASEASPSTERA